MEAKEETVLSSLSLRCRFCSSLLLLFHKSLFRNPNFHHEDMSIKMLEYMIDDNHLDYDQDDRKFLTDVIRGVKGPTAQKYADRLRKRGNEEVRRERESSREIGN